MCAPKRREADAAIADDNRGDALADLRQHLRLRKHDPVVMRVDVDETRRDDAATGIYDGGTRRREIGVDGHYPLAINAHISGPTGCTRAVDHSTAAQKHRHVRRTSELHR